MLQACAITKFSRDGSRTIVRDISLELAPGKLTALVGPSGGGKTTVLKCLSLLDPPSAGEVAIDDLTYRFPLPPEKTEVSPKPWPRITAVFQQLFLWPHLTLRENILLPVGKGPEAIARLDNLIAQFEMQDFINRYPNETSGGQRQRAAIARAVILQPHYILLDEITSALDVEQTARVLACLELLKQQGIGILLITHHIHFARRAADQVVFMADGQVVEAGAAKILDHPKSDRLKRFLEAAERAA